MNYDKIIARLLVLTLCVVVCLSQAIGQEKPDLKSNAIHVIPGTGVFWFTATLSYERRINKRTFARIGVGKLGGWESNTAEYIFAQYGLLVGAKNHHFEISAGPQLIKSTLSTIPVSGAAGYRFQKPQGWSIFRAGAAYPELYYMSFGVAF